MSRCLLCGTNSFEPVLREGKWQYVRCRRCGLVFLHPQPSFAFLHEHYQDYLPADPKGREAWRRLTAQVFEKSAALIEERVPDRGKLMDVGCSYGFFPHCMAKRGWKAEGIEISSVGRRYARDVLGLNVSDRPLPRPDLPDASFDAVTLFYVIEHVTDPVSVLKEVHRLLRPGGILLLRWPHTTPIVTLVKPWAQSRSNSIRLPRTSSIFLRRPSAECSLRPALKQFARRFADGHSRSAKEPGLHRSFLGA